MQPGTGNIAVDVDASNIDASNLILTPNETFTVTWAADQLIPSGLDASIDSSFLAVSILLYKYNQSTGEWIVLQNLATVFNTGEAEVVIQPDECCDACPVAIAIEVSGSAVAKRDAIGDIISRLIGAVRLWARVIYAVARLFISSVLTSLCQEWCDSQPDNIGQDLLDRLPPCPPTVQRAQLDNRFRLDNRFIEFFHPGAENCFRQEDFTE